MDTGIERKLDELRFDFQTVIGSTFQHFYCPILFQDDDTVLCRAHTSIMRSMGPAGTGQYSEPTSTTSTAAKQRAFAGLRRGLFFENRMQQKRNLACGLFSRQPDEHFHDLGLGSILQGYLHTVRGAELMKAER
jgi:cytochrome c peroxidase